MKYFFAIMSGKLGEISTLCFLKCIHNVILLSHIGAKMKYSAVMTVKLQQCVVVCYHSVSM